MWLCNDHRGVRDFEPTCPTICPISAVSGPQVEEFPTGISAGVVTNSEPPSRPRVIPN